MVRVLYNIDLCFLIFSYQKNQLKVLCAEMGEC